MASDVAIAGQENEDEAKEDEEVVPEGQVSPKEFDYLLTMPLWNLSLEKVEELNSHMKKKKDEYEILKDTHIYNLWK